MKIDRKVDLESGRVENLLKTVVTPPVVEGFCREGGRNQSNGRRKFKRFQMAHEIILIYCVTLVLDFKLWAFS